jgi:peptidoglycan/xylan/chitin deacetylase (PgdA/CDA1 family)
VVTSRQTGLLLGGVVALTVAGWHVGPAATWLPTVRRTLSPALDGRGEPGHVALTFDDGPDPASTPRFLRELDRLSVRATFFVLGEQLARHPGTARQIAASGHELAVHGWRHDRPLRPTPRRDALDLARTADEVLRVAGKRPLWYRPAYGILTGGRWAAARRAGLRPVLWSAWGHDWTEQASSGTVLAELLPALCGGATVLLHDSDCTSAPGSWRASLGALRGLVEACRDRGLTVGPLADHGLLRGRGMRCHSSATVCGGGRVGDGG